MDTGGHAHRYTPSHHDRYGHESMGCVRVYRAVLVTASPEVVRSGWAFATVLPVGESRQWLDRSGLALSWPTTGRG